MTVSIHWLRQHLTPAPPLILRNRPEILSSSRISVDFPYTCLHQPPTDLRLLIVVWLDNLQDVSIRGLACWPDIQNPELLFISFPIRYKQSRRQMLLNFAPFYPRSNLKEIPNIQRNPHHLHTAYPTLRFQYLMIKMLEKNQGDRGKHLLANNTARHTVANGQETMDTNLLRHLESDVVAMDCCSIEIVLSISLKNYSIFDLNFHLSTQSVFPSFRGASSYSMS